MKRILVVISSGVLFFSAYKVYAKCIGNETYWELDLVKIEQISGPVATVEEAEQMQLLWQAAMVRMTDFGDFLSVNGGEFTIVTKNP